jgi:phosphoribosylformylglycinamidine cyclo-ligase
LINALYRKRHEKPALTHDWFIRMSRPHRCYLNDIKTLMAEHVVIKGLAHITGGGLIDNPPRILPEGLSFSLFRSAIDSHMSDDFKLLWRESGILTPKEMYQTFNSGIGMLVVVESKYAPTVVQSIKGAFHVGIITTKIAGENQVKFC